MTEEDLADLVESLLALRRMRNPQRRAAAATVLLDRLASVEQQVSALRDDAVRRLREDGHSYAVIAASAGLTRGRVVQLLRRAGTAGVANASGP